MRAFFTSLRPEEVAWNNKDIAPCCGEELEFPGVLPWLLPLTSFASLTKSFDFPEPQFHLLVK